MQFTLKDLSQTDAEVILAGLGKLPLEVALSTFGKLQQQFTEQTQTPLPPPDAAPSTTKD